MSSNKTEWRFVNRESGAVIRILDEDSACNLLQLLETRDGWFLEDGADKLNIGLVENVAPALEPRLAPPAPPPVAPPKPIVTKPARVAAQPPIVPASKPKERREHERFSARFRILITCAGTSYQTFSSDISIGGIKLKSGIPDLLLNRPCKIFVSSMDTMEKVELMGEVIAEGVNNHSRIRFTNVQPSALANLKKWINESQNQSVAA